jgi:hypothetical protein
VLAKLIIYLNGVLPAILQECSALPVYIGIPNMFSYQLWCKQNKLAVYIVVRDMSWHISLVKQQSDVCNSLGPVAHAFVMLLSSSVTG